MYNGHPRPPVPELRDNGDRLHLLKIVMGIDPQEGGTSEVVLTTTLGELDAGIVVTLISPSTGSAGEQRTVEALRSAGARVVLFPLGGSGLVRRWALSPTLLVWLGRHVRRYDVVHIHGAWGLVPIAALVMVRIGRMPSVLTVHEALTDYDLGQTVRRQLVGVKRVGRRVILRLAANVVVASELERRDTSPGRSRVDVIPHPVADQSVSPAMEVTRGSPTVGFIGRFHEKKNLALLLEAMTRLRGVQLIVAGHGDEQTVAEMRALADRLGVAERVTWLGWIDPDARAAFYQRLDVLAMPSAYECYGMVAAEAMANGTPVVVTETTGAAELARASQGGLVTSQDPQQLAAALISFIEDSDVRELAAARAASFAAQRLTPRTYGQTMLGLYRRLRDSGTAAAPDAVQAQRS